MYGFLFKSGMILKVFIFHFLIFTHCSNAIVLNEKEQSYHQRPLDLERLLLASLDLDRDLERERERERDLERDAERPPPPRAPPPPLPPRFSAVSLILRPSNSVSSSLSKAYSRPRLSRNSTILNWKLAKIIEKATQWNVSQYILTYPSPCLGLWALV